MTAEKLLKNKYKLEGNEGELRIDQIIMFMQEYAKIKCQELLGIVAEKARIINEDGDVYQQPHIFFCNGEEYKNWVDKDSILNAVDLDKFIV